MSTLISSIFLFKMLKLKMFSIFWLRKKWRCDHLLCLCSTTPWDFSSEEENTLKAVGRWKHGLLCNFQLLEI